MPINDSGPRRTEYSKNGCKECKRRKIKCDEFIHPPSEAYSRINHQGRESCWQCTRLKKVCEYPSKGERVARVSRKVLMERSKDVHTIEFGRDQSPMISPRGSVSTGQMPNMPVEPHGVPIPPPRAMYPPDVPQSLYFNPHLQRASYPVPEPGYYRQSGERIGAAGLNGTFPSDPSVLRVTQDVDANSPMLSQSSSSNGSSASGHNGPGPYDPADLTLIATDLNNLVSDMIYEVNNDLKAGGDLKTRVAEASQAEANRLSHTKSRSKSYSHIPRNVGIGIFDVSPTERVYLQEFYSGFASVILPFNAFDAAQQSYYNPMRDILFYCAYNEAFMLAAILAQGARSVFLKSGSPDDEFAYYKYLSKCLELLGPALGDQMSKVESAPLPNIEAVLLTVLLLTSSNAANSKQNWRPHLRGAKDILLKHPTSRKNLSSSKLLLLCKYWFISFEILAGLGSKYGGTIESDEELDILFSYQGRNEVQVLNTLGLVSQNGFFLIGGFHIELIPAWKDLIKLLNRKRANPDYAKDETMEYMRLLAIFERQNNVEFVNKKALLKNSDFQGGFVPAGILLDLVAVKQDHIIVSWMDTSQQLYCLAASVTILTEFLDMPHDSPQVQNLVHRLTSFLDFLLHCADAPPLIKCAVMMIQWPMYVTGINSVREKDQHLALKFFDLAMKAGAGSAGYTIARMRRIWKNHETGVSEPVDDNVDVVYY